MGSTKDDKERSRRRSRSPSSDSDSSQDRKHKKSKKEHKHKHKHKSKKHKKHGSEVDEQQLAAAKAFLEQHLASTAGGAAAAGGTALAAAAGGGGSKSGGSSSSKSREKPAGELPADVDPLTVDDYFERAAEFTAWLQETRHQYFNELSSEQTHAAFKEFVSAWNMGRLPLRFYTGLAAAPVKRTSHNWGFKGQGGAAGGGRSAAAAAGGGGGGAKTGMAAFLADQQEQRTGERAAVAADRRLHRKEQKELLDELLPRATAGTREARVEARVARREEAKAREDSPDLMVAGGGANIMGGDDSFAAAKAREAKRQDWRNKQQAAKKEELAQKLSVQAQAEADKMAQFRALVAAQGGKISIPKRQ